MKRFLIIVSIVLLFMACDTGGMSEQIETNPFVGTWEYFSDNTIRFVFTDNNVTCYNKNGWINDDIYWAGAYSYDDNIMTVIFNHDITNPVLVLAYDGMFVFEWKFENEILILYNDNDFIQLKYLADNN